tara:strand:- start:563 stop:1528 length:966 start_codon:yes stop_codon:yes gene_type:complete
MGFSSLGVINWLDKAEMIKAAKEQEENKREALAFEIAMKYGGGSFAGSGSAKGTSTSTGVATAALMERYNLDEETLAPILATGDKTAAPRLLNLLEKQRLKYENQKLTLPDEVVSNIVESAVTTQPITKEIDFEEMEKFIGREMDSLYKDLLKSQSTDPGAVFFPEPAFVERPSIEDLDRFEKQAIEGNLSRAQSELDTITIRIAKINSAGEKANLTTDQIAERGWLTDRKMEIENAIKSSENDNVTPLAGLYGTAYTKELLKYYPTFEGAPINPALINAATQEIIVPNRAVAQSLYDAGILKTGDIVINAQTGNKIKVGG